MFYLKDFVRCLVFLKVFVKYFWYNVKLYNFVKWKFSREEVMNFIVYMGYIFFCLKSGFNFEVIDMLVYLKYIKYWYFCVIMNF